MPQQEEEEQQQGENLDINTKYKIAVALLGETSISGYGRLREKIFNQFNISPMLLPTHCMMTKTGQLYNQYVLEK